MTIHDLRKSYGDTLQSDARIFQEPTKQDGLAVSRGIVSLIFICLIPLAAAFVLGVFGKALVTFFGWGWGVFG